MTGNVGNPLGGTTAAPASARHRPTDATRENADDCPHVVVVEDEATQRGLLIDYLSRHGYRVSGITSGHGLRQLVERDRPNLVLLDIGLPGEDGFALARWLRARSSRVGIIIVSAASEMVDRVVGLETGADDYIAKPFEPRELLARVKSVLRREALEASNSAPRRLAAILAADVAGYSRLVSEDEEGTLQRMRELRQDRINPAVAAHRGRIVKTTGDGILVEFASALEAVRCAIALQRSFAASAFPTGRRIAYRVGIHIGDIIVDGDDVFGDTVNIAARLEGLAEPGSICLSAASVDQVCGKVEAEFADMGEQQLRNIARPIRVFRVVL
jgi:class 3 adenylate cyclase